MVEEKESVLVLTAGGYIKRTDPEEYRKQKEGESESLTWIPKKKIS